MSSSPPNLHDLWTQHQRRRTKTTAAWACIYCPDQRIFHSEEEIWQHALQAHSQKLPAGEEERQKARIQYLAESDRRRPVKGESTAQKASPTEVANVQSALPLSGNSKRPFSTPGPPTRSLSGLRALNINSPGVSEDVTMQDVSVVEGPAALDQPRKRAAVGDGISAGSASPFREESPPSRRSRARPISAPHGSTIDPGFGRESDADLQRPPTTKKALWTPDQTPLTRSSFDPANIASVQAQKTRAQALQPRARKNPPFQQSSPQIMTSRPQNTSGTQNPNPPPSILTSNSATPIARANDYNYDIIPQPETKPISQEQLVAEVKGIYAGLVMVEAKCIEVDNKQAGQSAADGVQSKLNNEQWQALIALHRTLLHEHHDFFLASQHPSASPALRRLASKYAMPARMWRHGIHSFLELLRHRLPASLDHMLAFIYLAYSMMALLYETVPAFEDTWIECLGDLGRYRMAIEDDDIRDREVWTGVARQWYSKASDKTPTTGRLYHHLAILARPDALQQLYYYAKSLCVLVPFTSARESILTLFDPVLNADRAHTQYRLPPLDTAFVKAHGYLFINEQPEKFEVAMQEFLRLLDGHIGRVTKKFTEQGYYIAIANLVAMLGFANKENVLMKALAGRDEPDTEMTITNDAKSPLTFENSEHLTNATLEIVLQRIGDPNVLPYIHVTLTFMYYVSRYPRAISLLAPKFPWDLLVIMLNTLLASYETLDRIEDTKFPLPAVDDARPLTEDSAMRGILWTDGYYPESWFSNDRIDDEEKYFEAPSMAQERKERILWLACRVASEGSWIEYNRESRRFSTKFLDCRHLESRSSTFMSTDSDITPINTRSMTSASATSIDRSETWPPKDNEIDDESDTDEDLKPSIGMEP